MKRKKTNERVYIDWKEEKKRGEQARTVLNCSSASRFDKD